MQRKLLIWMFNLQNLRDEQRFLEIQRIAVAQGPEDTKTLEALVTLAYDTKRTPCEINHNMTDTLVEICRHNPDFLDAIAKQLAAMILSAGTSDNLKKGISEIIDKLNGFSWQTRNEFPTQDRRHFADILAASVAPEKLIAALRSCATINALYVPNQFGYVSPPQTTWNNDVALSINDKSQIQLRYFNQGRYYVERSNRICGYLEIFQVPSSETVYLDINIFGKTDTGRGIGKSITVWAAAWAGPGNYVGILYPAQFCHYRLLGSAQKNGILNELQETSSFEAVRADCLFDTEWKPLHGIPNAEMVERRKSEQRIFLRGKVS